ncbi:MAG: dephospho-CoA kinase [Micavibrio sp.]|nr:dephospho-CoA kinase [Micavibrio sp.]
MIVIGITGSIGMGKSTAATMFSRQGIPVHDSDAAVHKLLQHKSPAWDALLNSFPPLKYPSIYTKSWKFWQAPTGINRKNLGKLVFENDDLRLRLESILHPYVRLSQSEFIRTKRASGKEIVLLDIPLLFETGADHQMDYTITVTAPKFLQHKRVLSRPNMSEEKFESILNRQMPDGEKCARADFVIHSGLGRAQMMREIKHVISEIKSKHKRIAA